MIEFNNTKIKSVGVGDTVFKVWTENDEKKLKGYQYDSLVYRYIRAREAMAQWEWEKDGKYKEKRIYFERADRDILRFCQILNETIGEHD